MIKKLKLKHLDYLMQDKIDYNYLMKEFGFKKSFFNKNRNLKKFFYKTYSFIEHVKAVEPKQVELNNDIEIKFPASIDDISFLAMMSIISYMNNANEDSVSESIATVIAIVCFSENNSGDFDQSSFKFKSFKALVLNSLAFDMLGLFNHLDKKLVESNEFWGKRFLEVEVSDEDYINAGGNRMSAFNVINTLKNICSDFNYNEKQAWQVPYASVQTSSLEKATRAHVQDVMRRIKEDKMKAKRKSY